MKNKDIKMVYSEPDDYFPEEIRKACGIGKFAQSSTLYKIKSVMIGHAVGDALGVPVEFEDRMILQKHPVTDMQGFGVYSVPAGSWSDDTSMSLCALEALCHKDWNWDMIMNNFVAWIENGEFTATGEAFDVGRTCLEAIVKYRRYNTPAEECGCDGEYSNGNGSLMRIHPFALYRHYRLFSGDDEDYVLWMGLIKQASALTHAHDRSVMACYIYGYCLSFLLKEPTKESLRSGLKIASEDLDHMPEFEGYERIFRPDFDTLDINDIRSSGYVVDTLEAALWCVLTTASYRECVLKAVNLGGDTDTVAAIAGSLAGALYGYSAIPEEWRNTLIKRDYIEKLCASAYATWKSSHNQ